MTYDPFEEEREIDEIRAQLVREMQELGKEEFERRQAKVVREAAEKYGFKIVPSLTDDRSAVRAA